MRETGSSELLWSSNHSPGGGVEVSVVVVDSGAGMTSVVSIGKFGGSDVSTWFIMAWRSVMVEVVLALVVAFFVVAAFLVEVLVLAAVVVDLDLVEVFVVAVFDADVLADESAFSGLLSSKYWASSAFVSASADSSVEAVVEESVAGAADESVFSKVVVAFSLSADASNCQESAELVCAIR